MIQEHYGKYIRDDGAALLRAYVEQPKQHAKERKTGTFGGNFSGKNSNYWNNLASLTFRSLNQWVGGTIPSQFDPSVSGNQLISWLKELDLVRRQVAA